MENLKYVIEDSTIAELLGVQNFTSDESAILELIKNSYDANSEYVKLMFEEDKLTIIDDGQGMSSEDIKLHWMHVGKSSKGYSTFDRNNETRVLSGSKGIGRFALSRLGSKVSLYSKKDNYKCVKWTTDWNNSNLDELEDNIQNGTTIIIELLRAKWTKRKVESLINFLSKTYNDNKMSIEITHQDISKKIESFFPNPKMGINYLSCIKINYDSMKMELTTTIESDEFLESAKIYYRNNDISKHEIVTKIYNELEKSDEHEVSNEELESFLKNLGSFNVTLFFNINSTNEDRDKFLYKYLNVPNGYKSGVILYRNAFSISSFEGNKGRNHIPVNEKWGIS